MSTVDTCTTFIHKRLLYQEKEFIVNIWTLSMGTYISAIYHLLSLLSLTLVLLSLTDVAVVEAFRNPRLVSGIVFFYVCPLGTRWMT